MLKRVGAEEWANLTLVWEQQCQDFDENFEEYALGSLPVLKPLAVDAPKKNAGVFGVYLDQSDGPLAILQANASLLPGYTGTVLRIRHIVLSPYFDFSDEPSVSDYVQALGGAFAGAVELSNDEMPAQHIKFHMRSPAEREFAREFTSALQDDAAFSEVAIKGSWIYLSKT